MKKPIINNFLCFFSLKQGAYFIAAFGVACSCAIIGGYGYKIYDVTQGEIEGKDLTLAITVLSINIVYALAWIASAVFLYLGAKEYNCKKLIATLILLALGIIRVILIVIYDDKYYTIIDLASLEIFDDNSLSECDYCMIMQIVNIIFGGILVYFFVCVANLYKMLKDESIVIITKKINITV